MDGWAAEKAKLMEQLEELKLKNKDLDEQLNKKKELVSKLVRFIEIIVYHFNLKFFFFTPVIQGI